MTNTTPSGCGWQPDRQEKNVPELYGNDQTRRNKAMVRVLRVRCLIIAFGEASPRKGTRKRLKEAIMKTTRRYLSVAVAALMLAAGGVAADDAGRSEYMEK